MISKREELQPAIDEVKVLWKAMRSVSTKLRFAIFNCHVGPENISVRVDCELQPNGFVHMTCTYTGAVPHSISTYSETTT